MEDSSFLNSPTSPGPTSPRLRPIGPRTRRAHFKSGTLNGGSSPSDETVPAYSGRSSPALTNSRPQSPFLPSMPSFSQLSELSFNRIKPPLAVDKGVQTILAELSPPPPARASSSAVKVIAKPPTLNPPPPLNFDPTPIQWRGLTLDAAQWTFTSDQLQDIVSRAIRQTAHESFIRLVSTKTLDEDLVLELERLDTLKATTQSQYRFNMHRRTMLLQSLIALSASDGHSAALANLTTQLADITVSCDRLMENMGRIADQRAQIQKVQDVHVASALAMALRKLNGSYAKRTTELREARAQSDQLKLELEEAWRVAQEMAQEMDDLDNFHSGFSDSDEDGAGDPSHHDESVRLAEVMNITGTAVATKATLTNLLTDGRPREFDRTSRVSAARRRSSRTSKASLRIPRSPSGAATPTAHGHTDRASLFSRRSRKSLRSRSVEDIAVPPVPTLHVAVPTRAATPTPLSPNRSPTPAPEYDDTMAPEPGFRPDVKSEIRPEGEIVPEPKPEPQRELEREPEPAPEPSPQSASFTKENFLEMSETRPGSPMTPASPFRFGDAPPPVPRILHVDASHGVDLPEPVPDTQSDATSEVSSDQVAPEVVDDATTADLLTDPTIDPSVENAEVDEPAIQEVPRTPQSQPQRLEEPSQSTPLVQPQQEQQQDPEQSQRPPTLNFEIPPITVTQEDEIIVQDHSSDRAPTRSQSMVEPRTRSVDDSVVVPKRAKSEYKRFDGWPWQLGRKTKRYSMPLTRLSLDSARGVVEKDKKKDKKNGSASTLSPLVEGAAESESMS